MKIAIVDDERHWRIIVEDIVKKYPWKECVEINTFSCGEEFYKENGYDLVFMDVEMKEMDGFETAYHYKNNNEDTILIFLTTHTELSRKGYVVNAFRYIDKANVVEEMQEALNAIEDLQSRKHRIIFHVLHVGEICEQVRNILYIETDKRNVIIHTKEQSYISNRKIDELEDELKEWGFFRCHKSYLVNLGNIHRFDKINVYFKNGNKAMVSSRKYVELKKKYIENTYKIANS